MSRAHYTSGVKKQRIWWVTLLKILGVMILFLIIIMLLLQLFRHKVLTFILSTLKADSRLLFMLIANVFIFGGCAMVFIYQWAERGNARFKVRRELYRSMMVSSDYYHRIRNVDIDQFMTGSISSTAPPKLQVDHGLKRSSLVFLDTQVIDDKAKKTRIAFRNNRLHGLFYTFFANGNVLAEISYADGLLHGRVVVYYPNGCLHNEKFFIKGKLDGVFRAWDEDGALFFEIEYKDGIQHGFDKIYRKNGTIEYEDIYDNGKRLRRKTFDDFGRFKYVQTYGDAELKNR